MEFSWKIHGFYVDKSNKKLIKVEEEKLSKRIWKVIENAEQGVAGVFPHHYLWSGSSSSSSTECRGVSRPFSAH